MRRLCRGLQRSSPQLFMQGAPIALQAQPLDLLSYPPLHNTLQTMSSDSAAGALMSMRACLEIG